MVYPHDFPTIAGAAPYEFANVSAVSTLPLVYQLVQASGNSFVPDLYGLNINGNTVSVNITFTANFASLSQPITGLVRISDNRTECTTTSSSNAGPCVLEVPFYLYIVMFAPGCPDDVFTYTPELSDVITWQPPQMWTTSGGSLSLISPISSGARVNLGSTQVSYTPSLNVHSSQFLSTRPSCTFQVASVRAACVKSRLR
jgi:hypothetical protein